MSITYHIDRMKNVYTLQFSKFLDKGITHQLVVLLNVLIHLSTTKSVLFIDDLCVKDTTISISSLIDIGKYFPNVMIYELNSLLKDDDVQFSWGILPNTVFAISQYQHKLLPSFLKPLLFESVNIFNPLFAVGDPYPFQEKVFYIDNPSNEECIIISEYTGFMYKKDALMISGVNFNDMSGERIKSLLRDIEMKVSVEMPEGMIKDRRYSVVHLRNEKDVLDFATNENEDIYLDKLEEKYMSLIQEHISRDDIIVFVTGSKQDNRIIERVRREMYSFFIYLKSQEEYNEFSAIQDLLIASDLCDSVLITPSISSAYGRWLNIRLNYTKLITFNMEDIA